MATTPLPDDLPASTTGTLALALGGSADSFTGLLLELMCKADPGNRARLAEAFPREDAALRLWHDMPAPTLGSLREAIAQLVVDEPGVVDLTADQLARVAFVRDAWGAYMDSPLPDPDPDGVIRVQLAAGLTLSIPLGA